MKIFCTLILTVIMAIVVERCRVEFLLVEIDDATGKASKHGSQLLGRMTGEEELMMEFLGYKMSKSKKCNESDIIHEIPKWQSLNDARKTCDANSRCVFIYRPDCMVGLHNKTGGGYLCQGVPVHEYMVESKGKSCIWEKGVETTKMTPDPDISTPASTDDPGTEKHFNTNPGIECCNYYNVDPMCLASCQQLDIPVNSTEESSRIIPCTEWSHVIRRCRNGWSEWKLDKCCKKYGVSNKCRPLMCYGECKNKPWELDGKVTGDQECDRHIDDVSSCCGAN